MSSFAHVERVLTSFLEQEAPGVIAVKGAWGVGKTYLWNHFVERYKTATDCRGYTYVSLFGVSSIAELRRAMFAKLHPIRPRRKKIRRWAMKMGQVVARHLSFDGLKNTELWADAIEDRAVREVLVCLDDLERKEDAITTSALLGLINSLREERRCKVVLLFNEERGKQIESFQSALAEYREKAIDREIVLQPTVRECYDLIFTGSKFQFDSEKPRFDPFWGGDTRSLLELFEEMNLANIRVMQKVRDALDYLERGVAPKCPRLWPIAVRQTAKLCWLHYLHAQTFAIEDVALEKNWLAIYARRDRDEKDPELARYAPVQQVAYHPHAVDLLIVEFIRFGFVDWQKHTAALEKWEGEQKRQQLAERYRANWDLVWDNFRASGAEVESAHVDFLRLHASAMSLSEVSQIVLFLRKFSENREAETILDVKIKEFIQGNENADPSDLDLHVLDQEIAKRVRGGLQAVVMRKPIPEAIATLTERDGWNPHDLKYLAGYSSEDFLRWMEADTSERLLRRVKTFRNRFAGDEAGKEIVSRLDAALEQIAQRSKIDALRVHDAVGLPKQPNGSTHGLGDASLHP